MLSNDKFPWIPCVHSNPPWWNFHVLSAIVILLSELQYKFFLAKWLAHVAMSFRRGSLLSCYKWRGFQWHSNIQALAGVNLKPNWFYSAEAKLTFYLFQELSYVLLPSGRDPKMKQIKDVYLKTKIKVLVLWSWIIASHEKKKPVLAPLVSKNLSISCFIFTCFGAMRFLKKNHQYEIFWGEEEKP